MLKHFILNKWTLMLLVGVVAAVLYAAGMARTALVLFFATLAFVIIRSAYKDSSALGKAYCSGLATGIAAMGWIYSLILIPVLLMYMSGPVQARSFRMTMAMLLGVATPYWCYLPYFLYTTFLTPMMNA